MKILLGILFLVLAASSGLAQDGMARACNVLHVLPFKNDPQRVGETYDPDVDTVTSFVAGRVYAMWADTAQARLGLSDADMKELAGRADTLPLRSFEPACGWTVHEDDAAKPMLRFTNPVFSKDGKLALVAFSKFADAKTGVGYLCTIRQEIAGWTPRCVFTWIS